MADAAERSAPERAKRAAKSAGHWAGYGWFMTFGTFLPLVIFLSGYIAHVTIVGAPIARLAYRVGIWTSTLGQDPPGKEKMEAKLAGDGEKKPLFERVRPYMPPGWIERRGRPVPMGCPGRLVRARRLVARGPSGSCIRGPFLLPYPLFDTVAKLLSEAPCVMTLAWPETVPPLR